MKPDNKYIKELQELYSETKEVIRERTDEFQNTFEQGSDNRFFEELCFCMLSSGTGPATAHSSMSALGKLIFKGSTQRVISSLESVHKYPGRGSYIVEAREYLEDVCGFKIKELLTGLTDRNERRDYLVSHIKGIGYLQASHFLRNVGFRGYAILDKNIIRSLNEFGLTEIRKTPSTKKNYIECEEVMKQLAVNTGIDMDHLDILLWYRIRGRIPR